MVLLGCGVAPMQSLRAVLVAFLSVLRIGGLGCAAEYVWRFVLNIRSVVRSHSLAPVDHAMRNRRRMFRVLGQTICLDGHLFGNAREIYGRKVYFRLPGFSVSPGDVVVDLGANAGVFTILAGRLGSKVIAVEAQSGFLNEIHANAMLNQCEKKVRVEFGMIGHRGGVLSDEVQLRSSSHFGLRPPQISMMDLISRHQIEVIDFLKIDIEGSEFDLFERDLDWLRSVRRIAMEVHCRFGSPSRLVERLGEYGFDVSLINDKGRSVDRANDGSGYIFARRRDG